MCVPVGQRIDQAGLRWPVENKAERAIIVVFEYQHDGSIEVRVDERWRRHQKLPPQRARDHTLMLSGTQVAGTAVVELEHVGSRREERVDGEAFRSAQLFDLDERALELAAAGSVHVVERSLGRLDALAQ